MHPVKVVNARTDEGGEQRIPYSTVPSILEKVLVRRVPTLNKPGLF